MKNQQLNTRTPTVVVHDNRGSTIREISYCRHPDTINKTDERITRHHYHARGYLEHSIDARLYEARQSDSTIQSNIQQTVSLGGALSLSQGVDNGNSFNLNDIEGAISQQINAKGTVITYEYTDPRFERNLDNIKEGKLGESSARVVQKFKWAQAWDEFIAKNQVGKCIEHFDIAGKKTADSFSLLGSVLSETQQLYFGRYIDLSSNNDVSKIENSEKYTTQYTYDATGTILTETDCKGHQRRMIYDIAGFVKQSWLTLKGQSEQIILRSLTYSAAGQKLREEQGNGLVTTYEYEPETQRLLHIKTARLQGHALGAKIMQDLRYEYDPVGNIICLKNDAEATRYWRNQKVVPENRYVYDSLYQLVSATGRESVNQQTPAAMQSQTITTLVKDTQSYTNYTRLYAYDRGGNLTQIRHNSSIAQQSFTQDIVVSNKTNRALLKSQCEDPKMVDSYFDESGNLIKLLNGDAIIWDERNHLKATNQVIESGFLYEGETYQYNNTGQRVTKIRGRKAAYGHLEKVTTHYLPNIEIWEVNEDPVTEKYIVAQVNAGTRAGVRALCWEIGSPKGIENNSLRYNYDDGMGNSGLETDGQGQLVSYEEYYPYGGTAIWSSENAVEADYKTIRYSGKEKDSTGMYYYGYRYYQPWIGRWLSADPAGTIDGLNLYRMVRNNPVTLHDPDGRMPLKEDTSASTSASEMANLSEISANDLNTHHFVNKLPTEYKELTGYKKGFKYGISELGKYFKIISTPDQQSEQLVITSHGGYFPWHNEISPPEGTTLNFLNPHKTYLADPKISNLATGKNKTFVSITSEDTIPKKQNAVEILNSRGLWELSGSHSKGKVKDYALSKYEDDTIESVATALSSNRDFAIMDSNTVRSDFLIVRNRKDIKSLLANVTLGSVLKELEKNDINYKNIVCGFCRSAMLGHNETYNVKSSRSLEQLKPVNK